MASNGLTHPVTRRIYLELLAWTLVAKGAVLILGVVAFGSTLGNPPDPFTPWHRWDAPHFTDLAVFGYRADDPGTLGPRGHYELHSPGHLERFIVFLPLYPWLVGAANTLIGDPVASAFAVSTVASLFVAPFLYRLVAADLGPDVARWSAGLLLVFPTAFFLHVGYTESLFLALSFGSLWFARSNRWGVCAVLAFFAALTRFNGLVLVPALAVEAALQSRAKSRPGIASVLAPVAALAGFAVYLGLNLWVYGDPFAFTEMQRTYWDKQLAPPWEGIIGMVEMTTDENPHWAFTLGWMELLFTTIGLAATVATAVWLRPTWAVWMAGSWLLMMSTGYVQSVPRYSLALFGIVVWPALASRSSRWLSWLVAILSAGVMAHFAWRFASGGIGPH